jgi:hypothetical protein
MASTSEDDEVNCSQNAMPADKDHQTKIEKLFGKEIFQAFLSK